MNNDIEEKNIFISPGRICFSEEERLLCAVTGSGVAISIFDKKRKCGGMCYYIRPIRKSSADTSTQYACPSIIGLLNMLLSTGSKLQSLKAQLHGGADNIKAKGHITGLGSQNVNAGREILALKKIKIDDEGIGGTHGRKIVFNTKSGETLIAKVDNIRDADWYPPLINTK